MLPLPLQNPASLVLKAAPAHPVADSARVQPRLRQRLLRPPRHPWRQHHKSKAFLPGSRACSGSGIPRLPPQPWPHQPQPQRLKPLAVVNPAVMAAVVKAAAAAVVAMETATATVTANRSATRAPATGTVKAPTKAVAAVANVRPKAVDRATQKTVPLATPIAPKAEHAKAVTPNQVAKDAMAVTVAVPAAMQSPATRQPLA